MATIQPSRGWATSKIEATQLKATLTRLADPLPESVAAGTAADSLVEWMTQAADSCLPKRQQGNGRFPVPWWSELIGSLRKECLRARRQFQRKRLRLGEDRSRESRMALELPKEIPGNPEQEYWVSNGKSNTTPVIFLMSCPMAILFRITFAYNV